MHNNSITTYNEEKPSLSKRSMQIMSWLNNHPYPLTDRSVKVGMGFEDMNMVRPRITELIKGGHVTEVGSKICPDTGKTVRLIQLTKHADAKPIQQELF